MIVQCLDILVGDALLIKNVSLSNFYKKEVFDSDVFILIERIVGSWDDRSELKSLKFTFNHSGQSTKYVTLHVMNVTMNREMLIHAVVDSTFKVLGR